MIELIDKESLVKELKSQSIMYDQNGCTQAACAIRCLLYRIDDKGHFDVKTCSAGICAPFDPKWEPYYKAMKEPTLEAFQQTVEVMAKCIADQKTEIGRIDRCYQGVSKLCKDKEEEIERLKKEPTVWVHSFAEQSLRDALSEIERLKKENNQLRFLMFREE